MYKYDGTRERSVWYKNCCALVLEDPQKYKDKKTKEFVKAAWELFNNKPLENFKHLCDAVRENDINLVKKYLPYCVILASDDNNSETPMLLAVKNNNLEIAKLLIENGAVVAEYNILKTAIELGNLDMIKLVCNNKGVVRTLVHNLQKEEKLPINLTELVHSYYFEPCNEPMKNALASNNIEIVKSIVAGARKSKVSIKETALLSPDKTSQEIEDFFYNQKKIPVVWNHEYVAKYIDVNHDRCKNLIKKNSPLNVLQVLLEKEDFELTKLFLKQKCYIDKTEAYPWKREFLGREKDDSPFCTYKATYHFLFDIFEKEIKWAKLFHKYPISFRKMLDGYLSYLTLSENYSKLEGFFKKYLPLIPCRYMSIVKPLLTKEKVIINQAPIIVAQNIISLFKETHKNKEEYTEAISEAATSFYLYAPAKIFEEFTQKYKTILFDPGICGIKKVFATNALASKEFNTKLIIKSVLMQPQSKNNDVILVKCLYALLNKANWFMAEKSLLHEVIKTVPIEKLIKAVESNPSLFRYDFEYDMTKKFLYKQNNSKKRNL